MTLFETIIYIAITGLLLTSLIVLFSASIQLNDTLEKDLLIIEEADFLISKINWILRNDRTDVANLKIVGSNLIFRNNNEEFVLNNGRLSVSDLTFHSSTSSIEGSFKIDGESFKTFTEL
jgi:hypothetical protein